MPDFSLADLAFADNDTDYVAKLSDLAYYVQRHAEVINTGLGGDLSFQGFHDASGGSYPSATSGQFWFISVAGTLGGDAVEIGDIILYDGSSWIHRKTIAANIVRDTSPQLGGVLDPNGHAINDAYQSVSSSSGTTTLDCSTGNAFRTVLSENTTLSLSNLPASGTAYFGVLEVVQDASASGFTLAFPAAAEWDSATALTMTATADAKDTIAFFTHDGGTTVTFFICGQAIA